MPFSKKAGDDVVWYNMFGALTWVLRKDVSPWDGAQDICLTNAVPSVYVIFLPHLEYLCPVTDESDVGT